MLKLNVERSFPCQVPVEFLDEKGGTVKGEFCAKFRIMSQAEVRGDDEARLLDKVLLGVSDIELCGTDGKPLTGEALLSAVKDDPTLGSACVQTYLDVALKKPTRRKT